MPYYDSEAIERARQVDLLTYLQTCEPQDLSMCPVMSTAPRPMTACGFPTASGAGSPVESADTAPWTISLRSMLFVYGRDGNYHRQGGNQAAFFCACA